MDMPKQQPQGVIAAIGASAGGITALQSFFRALPAQPNLTLVIIQHLLAGQPSRLAELIAGWTSMPVRQVADGVTPQCNAVYVTSPDDVVTLEQNVFRTQPAGDALRRPGIDTIDIFFESLAAERGGSAIGVVLTGTGTDGAAGALRIKQAGGIVLVQDPATAMYDGMPLAVIGSESADHILPIGALAEELVKAGSPDYVRPDSPAVWTQQVGRVLDKITGLIRSQAGFDLSGYKVTPLLWRIQQRMDMRLVRSFHDYEALLRDDPAELEALIRGIPIHVTEFFRDPQAWQALEKDVLHQLLRDRDRRSSIRAWTPGCATGEEAYSLAMLLSEVTERANSALDFQVFATDASPEILARASRGVFSETATRSLAAERKTQFFYTADGAYRVKRSLREKMVFAPQDLVADPPLTDLDLVTCRNLLIYLNPETAKRVLYLLHSALRVGGYLFLGKGETLTPRQPGFEVVSGPWRIYRKTGPISEIRLQFPNRPEQIRNATAVPASAHRAVAERLNIPSVMIDDQFQILRVYGESDLLRVPAGEPTHNLLDVAPPEFIADLRQAAKNALENGQSVSVSGLADRKTGELTLSMRLTPLQTGEHGGAPRLLVSLTRDSERPPTRKSQPNGGDPGTAQGAEDNEHSWSEVMRISHHELEASREELQVLNEELKATNDQLNITNEDLNRANARLQEKIGELEMQSRVLSSGAVTTLFLDEELRVRWFTPAVRDLFPLLPQDTGRRITDLVQNFEDRKFITDVRAVMQTGEIRAGEVRTRDGRCFQREVRPHLSATEQRAGVAVTFSDITARKNAEEALRESQSRLAMELADTQELHRVSSSLIKEEDLGALYGQILEAARALMRSDMASIQKLVPERQALFLLAEKGFLPESAKFWQWVHADHTTACGVVLASREPIVVPDIELCDLVAGTEDLRHYRLNGMRAILSMPLMSRAGNQVGVMSTHWSEVHRPSERELRLLDVLARQAADLIERMQAEEALRGSERRQAFLLKLSDALRSGSDAAEIQRLACQLLGEELRVDRAYFVEVSEAENYARVREHYGRSDSPSMVGTYRLADYGWSVPIMRRNETIVFADVHSAECVPPGYRPALLAIQIVAHIAVPLVRGGQVVGVLCVTEPAAREWQLDEVDLMREVADRLWATVERARAEEALRESEAWQAGQKEAFEAAVKGAPLRTSLGVLVRTALEQAKDTDVRCAFYAADHDKAELVHVAGMSEPYAACVDGFKVGADSLACGLAVFTGQPVITPDITTDPLWKDWLWLGEQYGYRGVWSFPIETSEGKVVGTFAMYFTHPREATPRDQAFAAIVIKSAAIIMARHQAAEDRRSAVEALRESEEKYRTLFDSIDEGFCTIEVLFNEHGQAVDYRFLQVNPSFERQTGIKKPEGRRMREIAPQHEEHWFEIYGRVAQTGQPIRFEREAKELGDRFYDVYAFRIEDPQLRRVGLLFNDITERKHAEEKLRESEERFRAFTSATSDVVYRMSPDWAEMRQLDGREFIADTPEPSRTWLDTYIHPDDQEHVMAQIQRAIGTKSLFELEHRVIRVDGSLGWTYSRAVPILGANGDIVEWFGAASDVTQRKRAEQALRESREGQASLPDAH